MYTGRNIVGHGPGKIINCPLLMNYYLFSNKKINKNIVINKYLFLNFTLNYMMFPFLFVKHNLSKININ